MTIDIRIQNFSCPRRIFWNCVTPVWKGRWQKFKFFLSLNRWWFSLVIMLCDCKMCYTCFSLAKSFSISYRPWYRSDMSTFVRLCLIVPWIIQIFHKIDDRTFRFAIIQIPDFVAYLYIRISKYRYFRARTTLYHLDYSHRRSNNSTVHAFLRNFLQIYCSISGFATGMNPVSCVTCHS